MYASLHFQASALYHEVFFQPANGSYGTTQTANVMPLLLGVVPESHRESVVQALITALRDGAGSEGDVAITTGGVGARWILQALTAANQTSVALKLASRVKEPSWGYMATTPPGTLWENWGRKGSLNHVQPWP